MVTSNSAIRDQPADPQAHLVVRGKAMAAQASELTSLLGDILMQTDWSNESRFRTLLGEQIAHMEAAVVGSGHALCMARLAAQHDVSGWLDEQLGGVSALAHMRALQQRLDSGGGGAGWASVEDQLRRIQETVVQRGGLTVNVTADAQAERAAAPALAQLVTQLPASINGSGATQRFDWGELLPPQDEAFVVPTQVNYVGKGGRCELPSNLHGCGIVLSKILGTTWLWDRVRVVGGAYGVFGVYDWRRDNFTFVSYRDPKLGETLETYDATAQFVAELELDTGSLTKAIVSTIGDLDSPMLPDAQGMTALMQYLRGETADERQARREQVLGTTVADLRAVAAGLATVAKHGRVAVVGSQAAIDAHSETGDGGDFFGAVQKLL